MDNRILDFRSDTVTRPSDKMRHAMMECALGDDVFDDDPTVNSLQDFAANLFNKQAALFFPTGTQASLCSLLTHCPRGAEFICGDHSHQFAYEGGGASALGSIHPQTIPNEADGTMDLSKIKQAIKPDDIHFPKTVLLCLENTIHGQSITLDYAAKFLQLARENKLITHLDGARLFNAAAELGYSAADFAKGFDSVSICLSKGLGAPAGTLLLGNAEFIRRAKRWRKVCGGGMRQAGILAAAGLIALRDGPADLVKDHKKAANLVELLKPYPEFKARQATNMVFINLSPQQEKKLSENASAAGILMLLGAKCRIVFHKDISPDGAEILAKFLIANI